MIKNPLKFLQYCLERIGGYGYGMDALSLGKKSAVNVFII